MSGPTQLQRDIEWYREGERDSDFVKHLADELLARIAGVEAALEKAIVAELDAESLQEQAEAALAERDRMLRLAWERTFWLHNDKQPTLDDWLADLRPCAEERSGT